MVAILSPASPRNEMAMRSVHQPFKEALRKLGYEPGRNIDIVERFAEGDESRLPALAAELVALQPQVLFTNTSYAASAAARATRSIPIVVGPAGETPLRELAGGSLARPTTNVTGFVLGSAEIDDKCITLLMEAVPAAQRVGVLINPRNPGYQRYMAVLKGALAVRGRTLVRLESAGLADIDAALASAAQQRVGALFVADDAHIAGDPAVRQRVLRFAAGAGMAVASSRQDYRARGRAVDLGAVAAGTGRERCRLCRQDPEGRAAVRSADSTAGGAVGDRQSDHRSGARAEDSAIAAAARRRGDPMISRHGFLSWLASSLFAAPRASAQTGTRLARIGWLRSDAGQPLDDELRGALRELGWVEGRNLRIETRIADNPRRGREQAAELQALPVALIVAISTPLIRAARDGAPATPIVMVNAGDALGSGFVASLARPGGMLTGTTSAGEETLAKQLELLSSVAPQARKIGVLMNPANPANDFFFQALSARARLLGVPLERIEVTRDSELDVAVARAKGGALLVVGDAMFSRQRARIAELSIKHRVPAIFVSREDVLAAG